MISWQFWRTNMGERNIWPGTIYRPARTLVDVNMGEGYEHSNDPDRAYNFLNSRRKTLVSQRYYAYINGEDAKYQDLSEQLTTVDLEFAWLWGDKLMVDLILKRQEE